MDAHCTAYRLIYMMHSNCEPLLLIAALNTKLNMNVAGFEFYVLQLSV